MTVGLKFNVEKLDLRISLKILSMKCSEEILDSLFKEEKMKKFI